MKARELAEMLMENPDAEVVIESWDSEWAVKDYYTTRINDECVNIPEIYENNLLNRPDEVIVLTDGIFIGNEF